MVEQKTSGSILFIASVSGHLVVYPQPQAAYGISKAAVVHLTKSLAAEWAVHGIRVNSISPGYMDTILNHGPGIEKIKATWLSRLPMGRFGQPSELVGTVVMLCSNASSYTTGADIIIDGEYPLHLYSLLLTRERRPICTLKSCSTEASGDHWLQVVLGTSRNDFATVVSTFYFWRMIDHFLYRRWMFLMRLYTRLMVEEGACIPAGKVT